MSDAQTPTPWETDESEDGWELFHKPNDIDVEPIGIILDEEDAQLIITAVNERAADKALISELEDALENVLEISRGINSHVILDICVSALAKSKAATGGKG